MKFRGVVAVEHRDTAAVDHTVRDDTINQSFVVGANVALVDALAEEPFLAFWFFVLGVLMLVLVLVPVLVPVLVLVLVPGAKCS